MKFIWSNAAVLIGAVVFVQVKLGVFSAARSAQNSSRLRTPASEGSPKIVSWGDVLDWKLKTGSHPFPGGNGGTCVNEAALLAGGFDYRPIRSAEQMPECFSRPICQLAMILNDTATDAQRQRLLPYVTRLACAGSPGIERKRASLINRRTLYGLVTPGFESGIKLLEQAIQIGGRCEHKAGRRASSDAQTIDA